MAALCLLALFEPDADPDRRFDGALLLASFMTDIRMLRLAMGLGE